MGTQVSKVNNEPPKKKNEVAKAAAATPGATNDPVQNPGEEDVFTSSPGDFPVRKSMASSSGASSGRSSHVTTCSARSTTKSSFVLPPKLHESGSDVSLHRDSSVTVGTPTSPRSPSRTNSSGGDMLRRRLIQSSIKQSSLSGSNGGSIATMSTIGTLPNIHASVVSVRNSKGRIDTPGREESKFEKELSKTLLLRAYTKGEVIVNKGDIGLEMMFIKSGTVTVRDETGTVVYATLVKGSFFGEIGVLFPMKRTASVLAETHCIVNVLRKDKLDSLLYQYPSMNSRFRKVANVRLQDIRQMNEKNSREKSAAAKEPVTGGDIESCPYPMPNTEPVAN